VYGGFRYSIQSLEQKGDRLNGVFLSEFVDPEKTYRFVNFHWSGIWLRVHFFNAAGREIGEPEVINALHAAAFMKKQQDWEAVPFSVRVPPTARYVSVEYGWSGWVTKSVAIPNRGG
jgi:hypothetical protein